MSKRHVVSEGQQWQAVLPVKVGVLDQSLESAWFSSSKLAKQNAAEQFQVDPEVCSHWDLACAEQVTKKKNHAA